MKRNILIITDVNFPFGGASANFLRLFSTGLTENNSTVKVLLQRGRQFGNKRNTNINRNGEINGVTYRYCFYINRPKNSFLKIIDDILGIFFPLIYILKNYMYRRLDYVILYTSNAQFSILNLAICKLLKIPIYNYVVEWNEKKMLTKTTLVNKIQTFLFLTQVRYLNTKFDGLIVVSQFLKNIYINENIDENHIFIQPNFVDFSNFENKTINNNQNNKIRVGYCGTPTLKDGVDDLLKSFSLLHKKRPNTELLIIGDTSGNKSLIPSLEKKAESLNILENVIFSGLVDFKEISGLLHTCNILVLARPSGLFAEAGFPTKLGEYMACKKPVVITKVGDIPMYLEDGKNAMLAEPDNPQSISDKIIYLIDNTLKSKEIGEDGYKWACDKLEYNKASKRILDFIDNHK